MWKKVFSNILVPYLALYGSVSALRDIFSLLPIEPRTAQGISYLLFFFCILHQTGFVVLSFTYPSGYNKFYHRNVVLGGLVVALSLYASVV